MNSPLARTGCIDATKHYGNINRQYLIIPSNCVEELLNRGNYRQVN